MRGVSLGTAIADRGLPMAVSVLLLAIWCSATSMLAIPKYLLPSPLDVLAAASRVSGDYWRDLAVTAAEAIGGFVFGGGGAFLCAILFCRSPLAERSLMPYIITMKTIPIVAIAPLLVIWLGAGLFPKLVLSALICFFPVLISTLKGLKEVDPDQVALFRSLAASEWQIYKWLRLPNSLTYLFPALRISVVFAVIGAVVAEFASANTGLGFRILLASFQIDTPVMFLYVFTTSLLSLLLYGAVVLVERFAVPWSFSAR